MVKLLKSKFIADKKEGLSLLQAGFGKKIGNEVVLHPLEAAYLRELELVEVKEAKKKLGPEQIVKKFKFKTPKSIGKLPSAKEQFDIFFVLRSAGRVVRFNSHSPHYWRVYARGVGREQGRAQILLRLTTSKWETTLESLNREISVARQLRMELVLAFIEKKQPAFVKVNKFSLD